MVSTFTPNLGLEVPARGDYPNQWDLPMDATLNSLDSAYGSQLTLTTLTGGAMTLTQAQANNKYFFLGGNLTSNQLIYFPPIGSGIKYIFPACTMNGFGLYIRGNNGADQSGPYFLIQFAIPYGVLVTPSRIYWDYGGVHVGSLADFPMGFIPPGWLPCDGRGANTTQQDLLFDLIGYSYGGSGSTFLLPDYRGCVRPMADNIGTGSAGRLFNWGIGAQGGESTHVLSVDELAYHTHPDAGHGHGASQTPHSHTVIAANSGAAGLANGGALAGAVLNTTSVAQPAVSVNVGVANIQPTGSNFGHNNVQPSATVMTCIRW
jgi:microcystin-dependent protein